MIRANQAGCCLPSSIAMFKAAARAVRAEQLREQEARAAEFMNARVRWVGWADAEWSPHGAAIAGFDHESLSARIMADLDATYDARMDAYIRESVIGDIQNWRPTGLFQPCSTGTEAGQEP